MEVRHNDGTLSHYEWGIKKAEIESRRRLFQGIFRNEDKTHLVFSEKEIIPKAGDNMQDYNGRFFRIVEILETRDHKGIYKDEANRQKISLVKVVPVVFTKK